MPKRIRPRTKGRTHYIENYADEKTMCGRVLDRWAGGNEYVNGQHVIAVSSAFEQCTCEHCLLAVATWRND